MHFESMKSLSANIYCLYVRHPDVSRSAKEIEMRGWASGKGGVYANLHATHFWAGGVFGLMVFGFEFVTFEFYFFGLVNGRD